LCGSPTIAEAFVATGLLALLDDITSILDDVSAMTKVAAGKTAGVLGDDLALNAQQVAEVRADRELPVVWAVAKGSALNKAILVPMALAISAFAPWLVTPLLMVGGAYLCFEGVEKLVHPWLHGAASDPHAPPPSEDERTKVRAAVRTDFVLSAEIIVITLGTVADRPLATQVGVMIGIAALMTAGVYGLVAGIVRLDDIGLYLSRFSGGARRWLGRAILAMAPYLMRTLSVVGTAAMFLVGGGILTHGFPGAHEAIDHLGELLGGVLGPVAVLVANGLAGIIAGAAVFGLQRGVRAVLAALNGIGSDQVRRPGRQR
jgi:predicted DNA repair protein MutK